MESRVWRTERDRASEVKQTLDGGYVIFETLNLGVMEMKMPG